TVWLITATASLPGMESSSGRNPRPSAGVTCNIEKKFPLTGMPTVTCGMPVSRSEEHTSELQSRRDLVCRLLLEKKKKKKKTNSLKTEKYINKTHNTNLMNDKNDSHTN